MSSSKMSLKEVSDKYWNVAESILGYNDDIDVYNLVLTENEDPMERSEEQVLKTENSVLDLKLMGTFQDTANSRFTTSLPYDAFIKIHEMILAEDYEEALVHTNNAIRKFGKVRELIDLQAILEQKHLLVSRGLKLEKIRISKQVKKTTVSETSDDFSTTTHNTQSGDFTVWNLSQSEDEISSNTDTNEAVDDDDDDDDDDDEEDDDEDEEEDDDTSSASTMVDVVNELGVVKFDGTVHTVKTPRKVTDYDSEKVIEKKTDVDGEIEESKDDGEDENETEDDAEEKEKNEADESEEDDEESEEDDADADDDDDDDDDESEEDDEDDEDEDSDNEATSSAMNKCDSVRECEVDASTSMPFVGIKCDLNTNNSSFRDTDESSEYSTEVDNDTEQ